MGIRRLAALGGHERRALPRAGSRIPAEHVSIRGDRGRRLIRPTGGSSVTRPTRTSRVRRSALSPTVSDVPGSARRQTRGRPADGGQRLADPLARAVPAALRRRQVDRRARPRSRRGPGPGPAQASTSTSSPLRNRWQRTPPVARPLGGYSAYGVTFTLAGRGAGQRAGAARDRDHDRLVAGPAAAPVDRAEPDHGRPGRQPDPGHAAGRPALRPDRRGAEPQQLRVAGDEDQVRRPHWRAGPRRPPGRRP